MLFKAAPKSGLATAAADALLLFCSCCLPLFCVIFCGRGTLIKRRTVVAKFVASTLVVCLKPSPKWPQKKKQAEFHAHLTKWFYSFRYLLICVWAEIRWYYCHVVAALVVIYERSVFVAKICSTRSPPTHLSLCFVSPLPGQPNS